MAACDLLATTDLPLSVVASRTGYYDQSHLSNDFVRERGMTPAVYRSRVRPVSPAPPGLNSAVSRGPRRSAGADLLEDGDIG
jgi:AraC-like DNA-binding protein